MAPPHTQQSKQMAPPFNPYAAQSPFYPSLVGSSSTIGTAASSPPAATTSTTTGVAVANPAATAQLTKVSKNKKKKSAADIKAGKQADELKRQKKLTNYRGFVNDTMGVKDMENETDPEATQDGVAGVVERALADMGITDEHVLTYVDDQVKEFLEQTFKNNFDELK